MKSLIGSVLNRVPVNIGTSEKLSMSFGSSTPTGMGRHLGAMEAQGTLFQIIDRLATSVAAVEWKLYRTARSGKKEDRQQVLVHPALVVWNKPNPHYTRTEFVETIQQHFELVGEKWLLCVRPDRMPQGPPMELWPLRPDRIRPVPHPQQFVAGYAYKEGRTEVPLGLTDVIFNRRPNPKDPYRGIGPIGTLLLDIDQEKAAAEWNAQFFRNGAEPGGIIESDGTLTDPEFEAMQQRWNQQHRGVRNAHRVAVIENGKWVERRYTQRDMQFEQLRRFSRESFRQAFGFPKPMLGDVEDVNRANAEAAAVVFAQWLLMPRLNRWRTLLNDDFLPMFGTLGEGYEFDYGDPVPEDEASRRVDERSRALSVASFVREGFDPAAVLDTFGFPPMEWVGPPSQVFEEEVSADDDPEGAPDQV